MRIDSLRDGFILCYVHKEWAPPQCSQKKLGNVVMAKAADVYQNRWAQVKQQLQGSSYLLGQRFCACFVLKLALQRGEGEKREGVQISKQRTIDP